MKISVSISAYNAESTIARTIESVLAQTYKDFEMVIINDGSTDTTEQIVEEYRQKNPEKIILKSIPNGGLANARNTAFPLCSGDLYVNLDADDYLESDTFEKAIACFENCPDADVCFYGYKSFDEDGNYFGSYSEDKQYLTEPVDGLTAFKLRIQRKIWICQGNAIYRMPLIKDNNIVNHAGKNQGEDMYFISRCLLAARKVVCFEGDNFCCMERRDSMNRAKFNTSFFQTVELLEQLTEDICRDYPQEKGEILPFIYSEEVTQILAIIKRMARFFKSAEYKKQARALQKKLKGIEANAVLPLMSSQKRLEYNICKLSLTMYYLLTKVYDKSGSK